LAASPTLSLFLALPGAWSLRRKIEDTRLGAGAFDGRATFAMQSDGTLLYEERGVIQLGAWRGPAGRSWIYALEDDALAIRYPGTLAELHCFRIEDGRPASHVHTCGPDRYEAELARIADGSLSLRYTVRGPAKDYRLRTLLTRL
jgi:hypothetical protein